MQQRLSESWTRDVAGELETRFQQLCDVRAADVWSLLNPNNVDYLINNELRTNKVISV